MSEHYSVSIGIVTAQFHVYVDPGASSRTKVDTLAGFLRRLPTAHQSVLFPIFAIHLKPGGRRGGGTWRAGEVRGMFTGAAHSRNTLVPDADVEQYVIARNTGMIGLSEDRWARHPGRLEYTLLHEVAHCIDTSLGGLVATGATEADFAGVTTTHCGAGNMMVRRAVEAYSRWICAPSRLYNSLPDGEAATAVNQRLKDVLRRSPAFASVSPTWNPT